MGEGKEMEEEERKLEEGRGGDGEMGKEKKRV